MRPALGVPTVPKSAKVNKNFTVYGSLKPHFPAGAKTVKLKAYRYNGHSWVSYKTYKATNFNNGSYTRYKLTVKITKKGKYRFKASTAGDDRPDQADLRLRHHRLEQDDADQVGRSPHKLGADAAAAPPLSRSQAPAVRYALACTSYMLA